MAQAALKSSISPLTVAPATLVKGPTDPLFELIAKHRVARAAWLAAIGEHSPLEEALPLEKRKSGPPNPDTPESDIDADGLVRRGTSQ